MSFNSLLLSLFMKNTRLGYDVKSLVKRYQTLSIIYANITILFLVLIFEVITIYVLELPNIQPLTLIIVPFIFLAIILLKIGNLESASASVLLYMHLLNFYASYFCGLGMASLYSLMLFPTFGHFLTSSLKVRILNVFICIFQFVCHVTLVRDKFNVTLTLEQSFDVFGLFASAFICMSSHCGICFIQKSIEFDIWEIVEADYQKSENLTKEVIQAVEAKDAFVSSLSHEIRNPLNSMNGSIDYLLKEIKNIKHLQVLKNAKLSGEILLNLMNNVLDAAKLKAEKMELSFMETNFMKVIRQVLVINNEILNEKDLSCRVFIDDDLPPRLWMDPSRLLQIVMNLMSNAIKFTPKGGDINIHVAWCSEELTTEELGSHINQATLNRYKFKNRNDTNNLGTIGDQQAEPQDDTQNVGEELGTNEAQAHFKRMDSIRLFRMKTLEKLTNVYSADIDSQAWTMKTVRMHSEPSRLNCSLEDELSINQARRQNIVKKGFLKFQISDTGRGISPENISRLFGMFSQAHSGVAPAYGGSGLGLWICKQLCQKMGGDIKVYSEINRGTSFVFYLPVSNDQLARSSSLRPRLLRNKVNALVVDDYAFNRDLHRLLLEREGINVILASDGKEAVEKYKAHNEEYFSFIMMDVQMPVMDGFTAAKNIREWETEKGIKKTDIYFVSGEYYDESVVMAKFKLRDSPGEAAEVRSLRKPIDVGMIRTIVNNYKAQPTQNNETL